MSKVSTASIKVGERLREDLGDLEEMMVSIQENGLLHPVVIDDERNLIAGQRRLEAYKQLGKKQIPVTYFGTLSEEERRELELEENIRRKDLTEYERSKMTKELVDTAKDVDKKTRSNVDQVSKTGSRGPAKTPGSKSAVSERTGIPETTIHRAEQHVAAGERYPFLQGAAWSQQAALKASKLMDGMSIPDRRKIDKIITESNPPTSDAVNMIESFSRAKPEVKKKVYEMFRSKDSRDIQLAKTYLANTAPIPDPRAVYLFKTAKQLKAHAATFKEDRFNARIASLANQCKVIADGIMAQQKKKAKGLQ